MLSLVLVMPCCVVVERVVEPVVERVVEPVVEPSAAARRLSSSRRRWPRERMRSARRARLRAGIA